MNASSELEPAPSSGNLGQFVPLGVGPVVRALREERAAMTEASARGGFAPG
jgi:hypothetical protein